MSTRRLRLADARHDPGVHAGLWLDKYVDDVRRQHPDSEGRGVKQAQLTEEIARTRIPATYRSFFNRWVTVLAARNTKLRTATVQGRMVVGLGAESVREFAITLHHTYGVPYIPGNTLKGLAAACARDVFGQNWAEGSEAYLTLFGSTESAGYVTFFDALYIPGSAADDRPIYPDVLTVHHPGYYSGENIPPADWDSPVPVPFISVGGAYLLGLDGPPAWVDIAIQILTWGLSQRGIGAKTSSGYGRLAVAGGDAPELSGAAAASKPVEAIVENGTTTTPIRSTRSIPRVGAVFTGKVIDRDEKAIVITVPGHPPEVALAILHIESDTPGWKIGDLARVEVMSAEERGSRMLLSVRRVPKSKKS